MKHLTLMAAAALLLLGSCRNDTVVVPSNPDRGDTEEPTDEGLAGLDFPLGFGELEFVPTYFQVIDYGPVTFDGEGTPATHYRIDIVISDAEPTELPEIWEGTHDVLISCFSEGTTDALFGIYDHAELSADGLDFLPELSSLDFYILDFYADTDGDGFMTFSEPNLVFSTGGVMELEGLGIPFLSLPIDSDTDAGLPLNGTLAGTYEYIYVEDLATRQSGVASTQRGRGHSAVHDRANAEHFQPYQGR